MKRNRSIKSVAAGTAAVSLLMVVAVSAFAWACTPTSDMMLQPQIAPMGQRVSVAGQVAGIPAPLPKSVEIRWGSAGEQGFLLGAAEVMPDGRFVTEITIPNTPAGFYVVSVEANQATLTRASMQVEGAQSVESSLARPLWSADAPAASARPPLAAAGWGTALLATGVAILGTGLTVAVVGRRTAMARRRHSSE